MVSAANTVVVGYDASDESRVAVRWAVAVANRRHIPLLVVHAAGSDDPGPAVERSGQAVTAEAGAQAVADEGAEIARDEGVVDVQAVGVDRGSVAAIVDYTKEAELVVLGTRGRGRLRGALLGSVAFAVTTHAACPVAVIRGSVRPLPSADYPIVVGVDGSQGAGVALDEAARLASETGSTLRITVAYAHPSNLWVESHIHHTEGEQSAGEADNLWSRRVYEEGGEPAAVATGAARRAATDIARLAAARVAEQYPGVPIEHVVAAGRAEEVIVDAAAAASLIVVGARGRGDFASLLLGSVSRDVMQRADCAVYVIR